MKTAKSTGGGRQAVGHPIDVASGVLFHELQDYVVPGRMPLRLGRRYSSALLGKTPVGMFGPCWTSPYEARLVRDLDGYAMVAPDGETLCTFDDWQKEVEAGGVVQNYAAFHELRQDGTHLVVTKWNPEAHEVERLRFEATGVEDAYRLCSLETVDGQAVEVFYDAQGRIERLQQRREGRAFVLGYDSRNRVTQVRLAGRTSLPDGSAAPRALPGRLLFTYRYDEAGRLREAVDALGQRCAYDYDDAGRLIREVTQGGMVYHFRYDAQGRCIESVGLDGFARTTLKIDALARVTQVWSSQDHVTTYVWNERGQVETEISPLGNKKQSVYDEQARLCKRISPSGATTAYEYDEKGDLYAVTDPRGAVTRFVHDERHLLVAVVDAAGFRWEREFDERGRLAWVADPKGQRTTYTYNPLGDLIERKTPLGHRVVYGWDPEGNLHTVRDALGQVTRYEYDSEGQLTAVIEPGARTELLRDALGRVKEVRLADGATRKFSYHPTGPVSQYIDENRAVTRWRYLPCGILAEEVKPLGMRVQYHYGTEPGLLLAITNEAGERHRLEYDADGRVLSEIDFCGRRTTYQYDRDGNVVCTVNAAGQATEFRHDASGALIQATYQDGSQIRLAYDPRGLLLRAENPDTVVERTYDELGRLSCEKQGRHEVRSEYDANGRRIRRESSLGYEALFDWNANDELSVLRPQGQDAIHFDYAPDGSELARYLPYGARIEQRHDLRGRVIEQAAGLRNPISGRVAVRDTANVHRRYKYDPAGQVLEMTDAFLGETRYSYDANGRILSRADTRGLSESFAYDPADNLRWVEEFRSDKSARFPQPAPRDFTYRAGNQLERVNGTVYEYDAIGQLTKKTDEKGALRYEWNAQGLLASACLPDGTTWHYSYDAFARRIAKQGPSEKIEFVWDGDVVLHELRTAAEPTPEVVHWEFEPGGFAPIGKVQRGEAFLCVNDINGTPRELLSRSGRTVWAVKLSSYGQVQEEFHSAPGLGCPLRFQGQWFDEETGLHYNRFRYYEPACGRYICPDPIGLLGGTNSYIYPRNPNQWIDPLGLVEWVDPNLLNFSQRTAGPEYEKYQQLMQNGKWNWNQGGPLRVMDVDGQLVSYDNRRLKAAQLAGLPKVPIQKINPADIMPGSKSTWRQKFHDRLNHEKNDPYGGPVPKRGLKEQPILPCK